MFEDYVIQIVRTVKDVVFYYSCAVQSLSYNQPVVRMVVGKDAVVRKAFNQQILINQSGLYALTLCLLCCPTPSLFDLP